MESAIHFVQGHAVLASAIVAVLGVLIYLKPKEMFKLTLAVCALAAIAYVITFLVDLTSTGIGESKKFLSTPKTK